MGQWNYSNSVWPLPNIEFGRPIRLVRHKNIWGFFDTYSLLFLLLFWLECCSFLRSKHIKPKFFIHKKVSFEKKSFTKSQILFHNKKPPQNFIRRTLYILDRTKKEDFTRNFLIYHWNVIKTMQAEFFNSRSLSDRIKTMKSQLYTLSSTIKNIIWKFCHFSFLDVYLIQRGKQDSWNQNYYSSCPSLS